MLPYTSTGVKHDSQIPTTIWEEFHMHLGSTAWTQALCPLSNGPAWWRQCPSIQLLHQCLRLWTTSLKYANTPLHQGSSTHFIHCSWISYQKRVPNSYCGTQKTEFGMKHAFMAVCVTVVQSCPTLWNTKDWILPGSSVHGILQTSGLPFPSPGDLPDPGIKPRSSGFPGVSDSKESACNAGDLDLIHGLGSSPREGNGYPVQ